MKNPGLKPERSLRHETYKKSPAQNTYNLNTSSSKKPLKFESKSKASRGDRSPARSIKPEKKKAKELHNISGSKVPEESQNGSLKVKNPTKKELGLKQSELNEPSDIEILPDRKKKVVKVEHASNNKKEQPVASHGTKRKGPSKSPNNSPKGIVKIPPEKKAKVERFHGPQSGSWKGW